MSIATVSSPVRPYVSLTEFGGQFLALLGEGESLNINTTPVVSQIKERELPLMEPGGGGDGFLGVKPVLFPSDERVTIIDIVPARIDRVEADRSQSPEGELRIVFDDFSREIGHYTIGTIFGESTLVAPLNSRYPRIVTMITGQNQTQTEEFPQGNAEYWLGKNTEGWIIFKGPRS